MTALSPQDIISAIREIGTLPQTLTSVLQVVDNPDSGASEIAEVISKDTSLTSRVLKMVNSVQYGRTRHVSKVSEAVTVMGVNSIKVLALSSSLFNIKPEDELFDQLNIKRMWRHFIETASTARNIAEEIGYREPEEAFVAGILHDVGTIMMILFFKEEFMAVVNLLKEQKLGIIPIEEKLFGFNHCQVGQALAKSWKLPERVTFAILNHHNPDPPDIVPEDTTLNNIVALADRIAMAPIDGYHPSIENDIMFIRATSKKLNLPAEAANRIRKTSLLQSIILCEFLELDIGDMMEVVTEANNRLAEMYFSLEQIIIERDALSRETENSPVG